MKGNRIIALLLVMGLVVAGCSSDDPLTPPEETSYVPNNKDGTEMLGEIVIADGSGIVDGGVGMVGVDTGILDITVPAGATVEQVLLYWVGGSTNDVGDDTIEIDGTPVTGALIGGPTYFYGVTDFYAYRADITDLGLVVPGANSFEISGFDFVNEGGSSAHDENNGAGILAVYDDGTLADLQLFDGLDMAFFKFSPTLDATAPVTFDFAAEDADRTAKFCVLAGSVGVDRPNRIIVTTSAGEQVFENPLGSFDGLLFDSICLEVDIPAGDTQLTAQLFSVVSEDPLGASMGWIGTGLSVPVTPPPELACLGDFVWHDMDMDGIQDDGEAGIEGVTVHLMDCEGQTLAETMTDVDGYYMFCELEPGDYNVHFVLPDGYVFSPMDQGIDDAVDADADPATGMTMCTTLDPGEHDMTWDAGMYMPVVEEVGCRMTGGGNDEFDTGEGVQEYTFGGQAGAPLASQPQPWGNWTHHQKKGPAGSFVFHAGTPSAPEGTEIDWIDCMDPGWCVQARKAPAKQLDFAGVGTFKNMKGAPAGIADHVTVKESLHWFEVNIDDLGEPGGHDQPDGCDPLGFGRNGGPELADCDCPDFYRIRIYTGMTADSDIMYEVYGYIDNGNFQIHPPTGRDSKMWY